MFYGDMTSLYQLGVGLNFGFGAIVVFAEPTRRQFERAMVAIESRLLQLTSEADGAQRGDKRIDDLYAMNKSYLELLAQSKPLTFEWLVWQSIIARLLFVIAAAIALGGLVTASFGARMPAPPQVSIIAIAVNLVPMAGAVMFCLVSCWYEYKILPQVELLEEKLFGRRPLTTVKA